MKKVHRYVADDGTEFRSEVAALNHELLGRLRKEYETTPLSGPYHGCTVSWEELIDWIEGNSDLARRILVARAATKRGP